MLSHSEVVQILISWIVLTIAFSWDIVLLSYGSQYDAIIILPVFFVAIGTAFVLHELAHKYAALKLGYPAEYRMWPNGLLFALLLSFLTGGRFVFAAPGAVYVLGFPNRRDNAIISLAGPFTNLFLAYLFLLAGITYASPALLFVAKVNAFIGFFNMMPIFPLDGAKVFSYSPVLWFLVLLPFIPLLLIL